MQHHRFDCWLPVHMNLRANDSVLALIMHRFVLGAGWFSPTLRSRSSPPSEWAAGVRPCRSAGVAAMDRPRLPNAERDTRRARADSRSLRVSRQRRERRWLNRSHSTSTNHCHAQRPGSISLMPFRSSRGSPSSWRYSDLILLFARRVSFGEMDMLRAIVEQC